MHKHHHQRATLPASSPTEPATTTQAAFASGIKSQNARSFTMEDIRFCAYRKWERAGKPAGNGVQFWLEAEQELVPGK
jgi:hypothetical protein